MSKQYPGGMITKDTPTVSGGTTGGGSAPGVWTLEQQAEYAKAGSWPQAGNYIEDVFSTWLYTGNGSTQTITNGINLSGKGGMVWLKGRSGATDHALYDTARGALLDLVSNSTAAHTAQGNGLTVFGSSGFTIRPLAKVNTSGATYASWTFRKQPKFFDVQAINHTNGTADNIDLSGLGTVGCVIAKITNNTGDWTVWHRSLTAGNNIQLNTTAAQSTTNAWLSVSGTTATLAAAAPAGTYVIYAYAHDAGGFGLKGTDNVISCGSYTGNNTTDTTVNLGYEPQWLLIKTTSGGSYCDWVMFDNMRGMPVGGTDRGLNPNSSGQEDGVLGAANYVEPTATGFVAKAGYTPTSETGKTYIYIAIRRGPMKVPTDGTKVFAPVTATAPSSPYTVTTNFPVDLVINSIKNTTANRVVMDRLRGGSTTSYVQLLTDSTAAESSGSGAGIGFQSNTSVVDNAWWAGTGLNPVYWNFRRAPGFFDEVCYTGTGVAGQIFAHNLGVAPELMIVKRRDAAGSNWGVYAADLGATKYLALNTTAAVAGPISPSLWNDTSPTSSVFSLGTAGSTNASGGTYVAYLFASCPGVSKVGSYTGTGAAQTINCGFTAGARFVLIKRTDSTGDWYVWDSARGIVSGNDPYLLLNSTVAEVTTTDYISPQAVGFGLTASAPAALNASGGSYIYLAIA